MSAPDWSSLVGTRVLDLSRLLPGPFATSLLADLGADVVKVEDPGRPDPVRHDREAFARLHRNKRSVSLDLHGAAGRRELLRLVAAADAVVENHRPGVLDALGLGYRELSRANPRIVLCSLTGYGQTGPYADKPGHDLNFLGLSGFFATPGGRDGRTARPGTRVGDLIGAMYAALALAVAVPGARRTGRGQHLDLSLTEAATAWCAPFALAARDLADPTDSSLVQGDNDLFETADGRLLSLATFEDKFWHAFRTALAPEFPALADDAWDARAHRTAARHQVGRLLGEVFRARELAWWQPRLDALNAPWAPVHTHARQLLDDPHARARDLFADPPDAGPPQVRFPVRFGQGLESFRRPAPAPGEHTAEVLAQWLAD
ncbi:CaiB/BaiF CoA transferase family protein [Kitasatospora viridis]|uniref:Crotonobetainyl-CoA:carnitine CoA-transferase CaiB-like acyl-CoA transferase n=1 Tax=Kitasatospora viridis TaxID=281105 RepID=A0A561T686_9ACTN|nr:CaiB/BaiF CoA-transferase family protein [Kitasatospora viridis]TWF82599.1 crotonobetainyl-CoA:carnitine CoA-transferase CaiB-like acyl-CoA transferase [Kitasatospora viridis]